MEKELSKYQINNKFINICKSGNIELLKDLLIEHQIENKAKLYAFNRGFELGVKEICDFFFSDQKFREDLPKLINQSELNTNLKCASNFGWIDFVRFFLTSEEFPIKANIHAENDDALFRACYRGHLNVVDYLLTSDELKEKADILARNGNCFVYACENGHLPVVQFLLTSTKLETKANVHAQKDYGFRTAAEYKNWEILEYLIFDFNIEITEDIKSFVLDKKIEKVDKMLNLQKINNDLTMELGRNKTKEKAFKI